MSVIMQLIFPGRCMTGIIGAILFLIVFLLVIALFNRIRIAIELIKEASRYELINEASRYELINKASRYELINEASRCLLKR